MLISLGGRAAIGAEETGRAEIVPQIQHNSAPDAVAFSPDGQYVVSASQDQTLKLWDVATGTLVRNIVGTARWGQRHGQITPCPVTFSPDGLYLLTGGEDWTLKLWEVTTGKLVRTFTGHEQWVTSVKFSADGKRALSSSYDHTVKLWEVATGKVLRTFKGHTDGVWTTAFAPDERLILSGSADKTLKIWQLATGSLIHSFAHNGWVMSAAFSHDGRQVIAASGDKSLKLWDVAKGTLARTFNSDSGFAGSVAFSPDGRLALSCNADGTLRLWDVGSGRNIRTYPGTTFNCSVAFSPDGSKLVSNSLEVLSVADGSLLQSFRGRVDNVNSVTFTPDGSRAVSASGNALKLWDLTTGSLIRSFDGHMDVVRQVALSKDGRLVLSGSNDKKLKLWELATGKLVRTIEGHGGWVNAVAFSPDSKYLLSGSEDKSVRLWDAGSGKLVRMFEGHTGPVRSVAFSPRGGSVLSGGADKTMKLWDAGSGALTWSREAQSDVVSLSVSPDGKLILSGERGGGLKLWNAAPGEFIRYFEGHTNWLYAAGFSPDGRQVMSGSGDSWLRFWETDTGRLIHSFEGQGGAIRSAAFSRDGKRIVSGSGNSLIQLWTRSGQMLAQMTSGPNAKWLSMTKNGFLTASQRDTKMLAIVRRLEITSIGQVYQSLFNPDLVREALAGDPNGEVARAAEVINLDKVLDSGPAPAVEIVSHPSGSKSATDLVIVAARITDRGKGVGRIEWRLSGVTAGVMSVPQGAAPDYDVSLELALDPGANRIEVIAYERRNLLASLPAQTTIVYDGMADTKKPKLYILAIGINRYVDQGGDYGRFEPLKGSVPDARAFSAEMEKAGAGQYEKVRVTLALDEDATLNKLDEAVTKIASEISPRDTFVLYAAAHGYSLGGNYYMIPQDYQGGGDPEALKLRAVSQDRIQEWLATRIKAKKALILLDTCESGALTGGYVKSRTEGTVSEAAVGRLHEATGRPVLTAASPGKSAYEDYKGHGVFTYALIEALHKGDTNNNGKIEVTELAAHVERRVPQLFAELKQSGWVVKGLSAVPVRRGKADEEDKTQTAHFGSTGEDFSLVARLP